MNISKLTPAPMFRESFSLNRKKFIPDKSGCYVLTTFAGVVLYIGLAKNLRQRMQNHLDSPEKTRTTPFGRAIFFYWIESTEVNKVERTWLNIHLGNEGTLPIFNKIYSPTSVNIA